VSTSALSLQEKSLAVEQVHRSLDGLGRQLADLEAELQACSSQQRKYRLLGGILDSLNELDAAGAADLFWDHAATGHSPQQQLRKARDHVAAFEKKLADIEARREGVRSEIDIQTQHLRGLGNELIAIEDELESIRPDFEVTRDPAEIPFRPLIMPWARNGEDERRYRKVLLVCFLFSLTFGSGVLYFKPSHQPKTEEFIPEHIAELVVKKKEEPKKPEPAPDQKPQDKAPDRKTAATAAEPRPVQDSAPAPDAAATAREAAQTKGVLALKKEFAGLIDSAPDKVGAEGAVSNTGQLAAGTAATRSLIVSQTGTGSGGINVAAISRNGTGGGGGGGGTGTGAGAGIAGGAVRVARVESGTGTAVAAARPMSDGAAPSRTDEEIQIVFDRYKAALYRIYNRELRNDPSLRGKMVLRLTIEPDGQVSACAVKSTDLASVALSAEVVERVLKFNFGPKAGVPSITIVYPIDFLPAA
jgi:hypothetical protein